MKSQLSRIAVVVALSLGLLPAAAWGAKDIPSYVKMRPRTVTRMIPSDQMKTAKVLAAGERRIIFMNRNGGTYCPGPNNSSSNTSSIPDQCGYIYPFPYGDAPWNEVMTCTRILFSRFNIEITDVDPGTTPHIESVVGGQAADVGMPLGVGGVSPGTCPGAIIDRSIVYTFDVWGNDPQTICEVVGQEVSHSFGIDHLLECADPMTYLPGCGPKFFHDYDIPCGEYEPRGCNCGGNTQNPVQLYYDMVGQGEIEAPGLTINQPAEGASVDPGFEVLVTVTDNYAVSKVELTIDGAFASVTASPPYTLVAPTNIPPGLHMLEVTAYDVSGNMTTKPLSVIVIGDCAVTEDCDVMNTCVQGVCLGDTGAPCESVADCATGLCAALDRWDNFCTFECNPEASECPGGYDCTQGNGGTRFKCWPSIGDPDTCAATAPGRNGGSRSLAPIALGLFGLGALLVFGRRRR